MTSATRTRVVLFLIGSSLAGAMPTFAQNVPVTTLIVFVDDYAAVPPDIFERAREDASRIFRDINVEIVWLERGDARFNDPSVLNSCFIVHILSPAMASRVQGPADRIGRAVRGTRIVHVFYSGIEALSRQTEAVSSPRRNKRTASILGHVIAHEIGHLLLPTAAHARAGIMQARMDCRLAVLGKLFFTGSQAEDIRTKLLAIVKLARLS
jgi:hypothetical protein